MQLWRNGEPTGCSLNIVIFPWILEILPPLPRQHWAAIGCTKNHQPIGVTVHSQCVDSFEDLLQQCRRGRGCSEKNTIFPEHPVHANEGKARLRICSRIKKKTVEVCKIKWNVWIMYVWKNFKVYCVKNKRLVHTYAMYKAFVLLNMNEYEPMTSKHRTNWMHHF